ncbi:hypothetical protein RFI_23041, partial [Reticulomyxa filosa]
IDIDIDIGIGIVAIRTQSQMGMSRGERTLAETLFLLYMCVVYEALGMDVARGSERGTCSVSGICWSGNESGRDNVFAEEEEEEEEEEELDVFGNV